MNNRTPPSSFAQGNALLRENDANGAIDAYLTAIDNNPTFVHYYANLSEALMSSQKTGSAVDKVLRRISIQGKRVITQKNYQAAKRSRLVNAKWYVVEYQQWVPEGTDAILHYLTVGWRLGLNPCRRFNTDIYKRNHQAGLKPNEAPLLHHVYKGQYQKPQASANTDAGANDLATQLWSGHSKTALEALIRMCEDELTNESQRWSALWHIARWEFFCGDFEQALSRVLRMEQVSSMSELRKETVYLKSFCLFALGKKQQAHETLEQYLAANPDDADAYFAIANAMENDAQRVEKINHAFALHGFTGIRLKDPAKPLSMGNVEGLPGTNIKGAHKVSVVMPIYNAGEQVRIAIESLLAQTYENIEIIAVDDCSPDNTFEVLQALAQEDSRIKAVQPPQNGGAYAARNFGLGFVTGSLITTHDSDDWSHPQKIATQVHYLETHPEVMGCAAHWIRAQQHLSFTQNWRPMKRLIHWSQSSFMFRREVWETLGGWDHVRIGGDTEFIWRMQAHYGNKSLAKIHPDTPLAFALDEESSLTRSKATHVRTVYHGLRHIYREISRWWHTSSCGQLNVSGADRKRPFTAPRSMFESSETTLHFDTVIAGDFSRMADCEKVARFIEQNAHETVALLHWSNVENAIAPLCNRYFEMLEQGRVEPVVMGQTVQAKQHIITDTNLLEYPLDDLPVMAGFKQWADF